MVTSHPARGAWIEIKVGVMLGPRFESHPARGAWIEIRNHSKVGVMLGVAPRKGCVD